jgi:uncharacterized protein (TIGR00369 family)
VTPLAENLLLSPMDRLCHELERPPFNAWLAPRAVAIDEAARQISVSLSWRPEFSSDPDKSTYHGGVVATLIDITGYAAVAVWHGASTPTIHLQVSYLAPALGQELAARGVLRRLGRSISHVDVEVTGGGKLVALGRGIFSTQGNKP